MNAKVVTIKHYLLLKNNEEVARILGTKESRIKYLSSKSGDHAKFKDNEIKVLVDTYYFNKKWLVDGIGPMINEEAKKNDEILKVFNNLTPERQQYYLHTIKAEIS